MFKLVAAAKDPAGGEGLTQPIVATPDPSLQITDYREGFSPYLGQKKEMENNEAHSVAKDVTIQGVATKDIFLQVKKGESRRVGRRIPTKIFLENAMEEIKKINFHKD